MSGKMNKTLPEGWQLVKLGDVCEIARGGSPRPIDNFITKDKTGINWIRIGDAKNGSKYINETADRITPEGANRSRFVVKGDFILSNSMSFGRPYIMNTDGCIHDGWLLIRDNKLLFDKEFLYYSLCTGSVVEQFRNAARGGIVNNLNINLVKEVTIPLLPLHQQKRIAAILNEKMAAVEKARVASEAQLEAVKVLAIAYLREAFPRLFDDLPEGWRCIRLEEVCKFNHGGTPLKSNESYWLGDIPWVSPKDMKSSVLVDSKDHITQEAIDNSATGVAPSGSLLIVVRSGILARYLPISLAGRELAFNQDIKAIISDNNKLDSKYLQLFLQSNEKEIILNGVKKGPTVHSIKSGYLENILIPLPPLLDQKRIASHLNEKKSQAEKLRISLEEQLKEINALPSSILRKAFSGGF